MFETKYSASLTFLLTIIIIISNDGLLTLSSAMQCYSCNGTADIVTGPGACGDPFNASNSANLLVTCNVNETCSKTKFGVNGIINQVVRSCMSNCEEDNDFFIKRVTCCSTDSCNWAESLLSSLQTTTLISSVGTVLQYYLR